MAKGCLCDHIYRMREKGEPLDVCYRRTKAGDLDYLEIGMGDVALFRADDGPSNVMLEIAREMVRLYNTRRIGASEADKVLLGGAFRNANADAKQGIRDGFQEALVALETALIMLDGDESALLTTLKAEHKRLMEVDI